MVFVNAVPGFAVVNLHPNRSGVDFQSKQAAISFFIPPDVTAIITRITVPTGSTNVNQIIVTITAPDGTVIFGPSTSTSSNTVTGFPTGPLPTGSTIIVALSNSDGQAPQKVTLEMIACYTASTTAAPSTEAPTTETPTTAPPSGASTTPFVCPLTGGM